MWSKWQWHSVSFDPPLDGNGDAEAQGMCITPANVATADVC